MLMDSRITLLRQQKGWSLSDLARAANTTKAQIQKLERGERRLSLDWMERIARALNVKISELLPVEEVECRHSEVDRNIIDTISKLPEQERSFVLQTALNLIGLIQRLSVVTLPDSPAEDPKFTTELADRWSVLNEAQRAWALKMIALLGNSPSDEDATPVAGSNAPSGTR